jgi:hypothetical protein
LNQRNNPASYITNRHAKKFRVYQATFLRKNFVVGSCQEDLDGAVFRTSGKASASQTQINDIKIATILCDVRLASQPGI